MTKVSNRVIGIAGWGLGLAPALALAAPARPPTPPPAAIAAIGVPGVDGRLFGHLPYVEALPDEVVVVAPGFGIGVPCRMQRDAAADLVRLLDGAKGVPGVAGRLKGVSCYRTVAHQLAVFCHPGRRGIACRDAVLRAHSVGPPGFSEHATGYALDFGIRPTGACRDVDPCIADTPAGKWLLDHAPEYGFELSFPEGNAQGVTWEPWHWRWVGTSIDEPGAARARLVFARARSQFPASPMISDGPAQAAQSGRAGPPAIVLLPGMY
ncbi:hypothetical protein GCM10009087_23960 [Sphingomonas oligophenolica]|uniref:M15 family metallopeptidase n=1 Tax=Sphingomonas oligophenolica TaxID=301154 RepID=A0ABU9Y1F3_9SPHN